MCAEKVHKATQTSRSPMVAPTFIKTSRVPMVAPAVLYAMKAAPEPVIKLPLESKVAKQQQTLNKPVEKGVKSTMHKHTIAVTREKKLKSSICGKTCNKQDTIRLDSTKRGNHQAKAEFKMAGLTEPLSINEETDEKANCTIVDVDIINSDVERLNSNSHNKLRNYSRCAASAAHDITQGEAAVPKTIGQPRQNVQALFSTLPVEQGFCGNVDKGIAHHSSLLKKDCANDKVSIHRCKHSAFETPLLLCSLRNEGREVSAPTCDPTYQESIQRTSSQTRQDLDFHLESDRQNLNENGRLKFKGVQEVAVQTSPKTRNNAPSASVVDGRSNLDVLSMYFPSLFPDVNNPLPQSYSGFSFPRENNQLMEDLWQCLDDVKRRQLVLNDNLDLSARKRHSEELTGFMEYLPTNPNLFKEKLSIKQRVEDYILSVRAEILSSVKEQLNAEKQAKAIKPSSFSVISTRGKRTCSGRGRNVSTGQLEIKPRATHQMMMCGASQSTSKPSLPKPPPPKAAIKQHDAVPQHTPISMWSEESHRPVYGNLLGLGKQTREIRPYLHLKNALPSQPVPWPLSPPPKSITGGTTKKLPSHLKINPFTQAVGLSLSQKSQTIASDFSKDERSVLQEDRASGQAEVKGTKPRVTFLDDSVTSVTNPETENISEMLISSLESSEHEPSSIEDSYAHVLNSTVEDSFHQEGSSENLNKNEEGESDNVNSNLTTSAHSSPELEAAPEVNILGTYENSEKWPEDCDNQIEVILESDGVAMQNSTTTQQQLGQGVNYHTANDVMLSSKTTDFSKAAVETYELHFNDLQEVVGFRDHYSNIDGLSPKQISPSVITHISLVSKTMPSERTREFTMKNSSQPNLALHSGLTSSEQYLNEAKYWIEQELLARSLSLLLPVEEVKRPDPSVARVPLLAQQLQEENWLMGIIGAEGAKLFMEAGTSIDEELICKLVKDVINEQAVTYILANRKLNSKKELPSDASLEASSQSYSKDSFVSASDSKIEKSEEPQEIIIDEEPKEDLPLNTPVVTPAASPVGSRSREVFETAVEVLPQFFQDPIHNPSVDRPVTPNFSESASENETEERLPGGGLWASESDPMHRNGTNPSSPANTPRATPSPQPEVPLSPLEQVHPPTTPQLSSMTESSSPTGAALVAPSALWNQGTQTSPRIGPLGNQLASDGQQVQTDRPVEHPLPQRTISRVDQGVGSSPPPSIETINGGIEDTQVDFDLSEGEWLMYQHQVQRLLPFARYGAQHSSTQFSVSRGSGGSMDNTLLDSEELERDPISEGEIPLSFSPEWVTSMLALIAELQSSGQVLGPSASSDATAFIARARNLGTGSTSQLPSPGEVSTPHAVLHHHSRQPSRLSTAIHSASQVASTTAFGVGERVRFPYAESFTRRNPVLLVDIVNDDRQHQDIESIAIHDRQHGPAELSFVAGALSAPESPVGVPYLEPLVSEGELRSSVVPTGSHQSEPDHSQSSIVIEPSTTLKRSSSTPSTSIKSVSQRRYSGAIPSRSQAIGTATMTSAITAAVSATTFTSVSQPLLTHRDSSIGSRALPDHTKTGTERELDLHIAPVYRLAAAREEIAISLPPGSPLATSADVMRSRRTSPAINYGTDRHVDNVTLTTATSGEGGNEPKSSKANATSQLKDITDSPSKLGTDAALLSPGQVSSPNPSPPPAVNISASSSASEGEARLC